ncbi:unnamed protein product [Mycena citricolor]|uniref:Uncharacterized protein n=1 Tax=Mycena citricolor TaxID=2018698 RepID=A0AAD2GV17_9AGAR|nr:unnamed protein product [Mycena citricolor]
MPPFSSLWRSRRSDDSPDLLTALPLPTIERRRRKVEKASIGVPVLLSIPRRFECLAPVEYTRRSLTSSSLHNRSGTVTGPATRTAEVRPSTYPLIRSYSLPTPSSPPMAASPVIGSSVGERITAHFSAPPAARSYSHSPLHIDTARRPLSPIQEHSYASPMSLRATSPVGDISPLDLPRPTPVARAAFIHRSISDPPALPPLNFAPYFPGPHPFQEGDGPPRRPPRVVQTIYSAAANSSTGSLHAESFVTAASREAASPKSPERAVVRYSVATSSTLRASRVGSPMGEAQLQRGGTMGSNTGNSSLRRKPRHWFDHVTPAAFLFCLGFLCPPCWWIGGYYVLFFTEVPPQRTLWEHYVTETRWWGDLTCGVWRANLCRRNRLQRKPEKPLLLPRWVAANNTSASLTGISYYYPFVSRPAPRLDESGRAPSPQSVFAVVVRRLNAWIDYATFSRFEEVKRARESPLRIIDPWIERCRRAFCYWCGFVFLSVLVMIGWNIAVATGVVSY